MGVALSPLRMRGSRQAGLTLIELMIVVAIVGILAAVAVYMFTRTSNKAKIEAEVPGVIAEFKIRQEQYAVENGMYLDTLSESDAWPSIGSPSAGPTTIAPLPDEWDELKITLDKTALYCTYTTVAGAAGDDSNIGAKAQDFGMTAPATNWYYVLAECDADNDSSTNSFYFARSDTKGIASENEGR